MKTSILAILLLLSGNTLLPAQQVDFNSVNYTFGKFEGDLPSGQKFYITGPLINTDAPPADVVVLNIYQIKRKSKTPETCPHYSGYYWKPKGDNSTQFKIFVDRQLLFSRNYKFEFQYFSSAQYTAGKNIIGHFVEKLEEHFSAKKALSDVALINMLAAVNESLADKQFGTLGYVPNNSCHGIETFQFQNQVQPITFPIKTKKGDITALELAGMITDRYLAKSGATKVADAKAVLTTAAAQPDAMALLGKLENLLTVNPDQVQYSAEDLNRLKTLIKDKDFSANPFSVFKTLYTNQLLNIDQKQLLAKLDNAMQSFMDETERLAKNKSKVASAEAKTGTMENIVLTGYTLSGTSISYNTIQQEEAVKTDATRATTPAGISGVLLNPVAGAGRSETDAFGNAAIRSYLLPVDKRLPGKQAYVDWARPFNRMSATFGVSVSPITYRGESLKSAVGLKPIFALGYDISRAFSLDIGGVLFRQENPNPLINDSAIRLAPIISIQFDANLINRFKSLGTGF